MFIRALAGTLVTVPSHCRKGNGAFVGSEQLRLMPASVGSLSNMQVSVLQNACKVRLVQSLLWQSRSICWRILIDVNGTNTLLRCCAVA
jgi:hypothetical protein